LGAENLAEVLAIEIEFHSQIVSQTISRLAAQPELVRHQTASRASNPDRIEAALAFEASAVKSGVRPQALMPLQKLFATQAELGRAEFKAMTGLGERVATETLSSLPRRGCIASDSACGKLRFAVPRHALRFCFPA
jgi:hypothetical protein